MTDVLAVVGGGSSLLIGLCVVACPAMMGVMMWMGRRGAQSSQQAPPPMPDPAKGAELARLRAEIDQLKAAEAHPGDHPTRPRR